MRTAFFSILISLFFGSCGFFEKKESHETPKVNAFAEPIEQAHEKSKLMTQELIQFDMSLVFRGKIRFQGQITLSPDGGLVRMEDSSKTLIWNGEKAIIERGAADLESARFSLLTWSYFFLAPYKLNDPGTHTEPLGKMNLNGQAFEASRLTFDNGVGETPDDWYICYRDLESNLLVGMAYIVTGSQSVEEAEKDPHCITYEAFDQVGGIPFATQWNFWTWNEAGELSKLLGSAQISKVKFIKKEPGLFQSDSSL